MKTSHKSDELKKKNKKEGAPQIGYLWLSEILTISETNNKILPGIHYKKNIE